MERGNGVRGPRKSSRQALNEDNQHVSVRIRQLTRNGEDIILFLLEAMSNEDARLADRLVAAHTLMDRAYGRAFQSVEIDLEVSDGNKSKELAAIFTIEEMRAMLASMTPKALPPPS